MKKHARPVVSRRALIGAAPLLLGMAPPWQLEVVREGVCAVVGRLGRVEMPATRARIAAVLRMGGADLVAVAFGADAPGRAWDLLALVGGEEAGARLVGLEVLGGRAADGTLLSTRLSSMGDGVHIRLSRDAARRDTAGLWHREAWTDHLAWRQGAALVATPARPPMDGSWQARLASARTASAAMLQPKCHAVTPAMLACVAAVL